MTLPNFLTLMRVVMIPFTVGVFYLPFIWAPLLACALFTIAAITDWFDGYLARKWNQSTPFGAFLDPVADKLIVAASLVVLVEFFASPWLTIPAIIIISREITITALREWMAQVGKRANVAVSMIGKIKTTFQMIAIGVLLATPAHSAIFAIPFANWLPWLGLGLLQVAAVLTLWSMFVYLRAALPILLPKE
ncbi:CDP-diacylglycerol--glycerol-3-phosphate 3-phosphatidyltransferase [Salinibius halmophilus]|uniref:CDP-diacylglycerol--glycerol-3-phosphate 3-phosphatidyltransferase n=1 Tax=Salinibius halmophilus TaxID=1853216 RepID=UPI000E66EC05|nr:CDP-diacylglycerol--glycerol-3-phosphate 3-phosphatidyltransferase [Salinibius halmophilus]